MIKDIEKERSNMLDSDSESDDGLEEETTERYHILDAQDKYDRQRANAALPKDDTDMNYLDPIELRKQITSLNGQQRKIFDDIVERVNDGDMDVYPFNLYIGGEAGTGKSYVLKLLIYGIRQLKVKSGQELDKPTVIVMAPTANAAFAIKGKTIESAMHINMDRYHTFSKASSAKISQLAFEYQDVAALIIDEISMVGTDKLAAINFQMQNLAEGSKKNTFMGGKSCIAAGDFRQLPPVLDQPVYIKSKLDGRPSIAPCHWSENFKIYYLTQKMRCPDDIEFAELCDRIGTGSITDDDEKFLKSKIVNGSIKSELDNDNFTSGKVAIIVTTNEKREEINLNKLRNLIPYKTEYICLADDKVTNRKNHIPIPDTVSYSKSYGMMKNLIIREGAPVMITTNHKTARYKEDGIVNGAKGHIVYIETSKGNPDLVEIIWVVFQNQEIGAKHYKRDKKNLRPKDFDLPDNALPILPIKKPIEVEQGNIHYIRKQFPIALAYAFTDYKSQGSTLKEVIVDFRCKDKKRNFIGKGSFYVAVTRVTNGNNVYLRSFERSFIRVDPRVEYEINTMRTVRPYQMKKVYLYESVFESGEEVKIGYLNINSLIDGYHAEYLNGDYNLNELDLLAISETHLTRDVSSVMIEQILSNWVVVARYDSPDNIKHMGILILASKTSKFLLELKVGVSDTMLKGGQPQIQCISCSLKEMTFSFVYCRTTPNISEAEWVYDKTKDNYYILGDFNLDPTISSQKYCISKIYGNNKISLLNEITTKNGNQLDHIGGVKHGTATFTTSFTNFISDHKSVTIRISLSGSSFIKDERLPINSDDCDRDMELPSP